MIETLRLKNVVIFIQTIYIYIYIYMYIYMFDIYDDCNANTNKEYKDTTY